MQKDEFTWHQPLLQQHNVVGSGDLRVINLPVKVIFEWSDKIVADYDSETDTILEYTSGYIMKVLPNQSFVYKNEESLFLAHVLTEGA